MSSLAVSTILANVTDERVLSTMCARFFAVRKSEHLSGEGSVDRVAC